MNKKVLDIWAVQNISSELYVALNQLKSNDVIVFDNACIELQIGNEFIADKVFACAIFSEQSDTMILIMKHANVTTSDVIKYLEENGINYSLVSFLEEQTEKSKITTPEIWFARDPYVVEDACEDSLNKNITNLVYSFDKEATAKLKFKYLASSEEHKEIFNSSIQFKGLITLEDKIILVVNDNPKTINSKHENMEVILIKQGFENIAPHSID